MLWEGDWALRSPKLFGDTLSWLQQGNRSCYWGHCITRGQTFPKRPWATPPGLAPKPYLGSVGTHTHWWPCSHHHFLLRWPHAHGCRSYSQTCRQLAMTRGWLQSLYICLVIFKTGTAILSPKPSRELQMEADQIKTVPSTPGAGAEITPCNYNVVNLWLHFIYFFSLQANY